VSQQQEEKKVISTVARFLQKRTRTTSEQVSERASECAAETNLHEFDHSLAECGHGDDELDGVAEGGVQQAADRLRGTKCKLLRRIAQEPRKLKKNASRHVEKQRGVSIDGKADASELFQTARNELRSVCACVV